MKNEKITNSDEKKEKIEIPINNKTFRYAVLLVAFGVLFYSFIQHISVVANAAKWVFGLFLPLVIGFCIAFVINAILVPVEKNWERIFKKSKGKLKIKLKRPVCLVISILFLLGMIFAVIFMIVPEFIKTGYNFINMLPSYIHNLENWWNGVVHFFENYNVIIPEIQFDYDKIGNIINEIVKVYGNSFIDKTVSITTSIFGVVVDIAVAIGFSMYLLAQKEKLCRQARMVMYAVMPQKKTDKIIDFLGLTNVTFTNFVTGQLTEAVILGVLCFIGMLIFGFPYASVISVLVGFTALIPVFGAFVGNAIGAFLILLINPIDALWFTIFLLILQQLENNLIYPKVVGKSVGLPGIWVLAAVTVGGNLSGVLGMLFSVPVCSVLYCLFKRFIYKRSKKEPKKPELSDIKNSKIN